MNPAAPLLRADAISAGYHDHPVLQEISLHVHSGELVAVVGPNGAGKSTLLKVLSGALAPFAGRVELLGRPLAAYGRRETARYVAALGQESSTAFAFTVIEMVLMGRSPHLRPLQMESARDLEIARAALARFGLLELATRPINELSGGERRRVFLARALAQEPAVALLDEPTAFLDLKHVSEIFALIAELRAERSMGVVASLHDLNAAALYADRVLLLKEGRTIGCGPPEEILTAENLHLVYEAEIYVGRNPATGAISVLPTARQRHR